MSAPVDVLQVMREASVVLDQDDRSDTNEKLLAAVDAVAELIEATREMMRQDAVQRATHNTNPFMADAADKLMAALGKVGAK